MAFKPSAQMSTTKEDHSGTGSFIRSLRRASQFADPRPRIRRIYLCPEEEVAITVDHRHLPEYLPEGGNEIPVIQIESPPQPPQETSPLLGSSNRGADDAIVSSDAESEFAPLRSKLSGRSLHRVDEMQQKRDEARARVKGDEREPLLITHVRREDGTEAEVIIGQSTLAQTIFNSANTLVGVGLLSLPLAIRYAGWIIGIVGLLASAWVTRYTAGLLAKCLDVDSSLANFGDIAFVAFGEKGRLATSTVIVFELLLTLVGLIILFADTLRSIIDGPSELAWKCICGVILMPMSFLPMRWLGYTSFLGIFCSIGIIIIAVVLGFLKPHSPGSLREVAETTALPENWKALPLAFGLIMALWTGHSVFPNIYRDMRHPYKYGRGLRYIFSFVTCVDITAAVVGYLLYGRAAKDELSTNLILTEGYPYGAKLAVLVLIAIVPITKFPLQSAPIVSTLEVFTGIDDRVKLLHPNRINQSKICTRLLKVVFRVLVTILAVAIAAAIPDFEFVAGILGGLFGYLICIIVPVVFHLTMFRAQMSRRRVMVDSTIVMVASILGITGTVWEVLPSKWIGVEPSG